MKSLIGKIFKRGPVLNYVIAEYKPNSDFAPKPLAEIAEYDVETPEVSDEMAIDNIYQSN